MVGKHVCSNRRNGLCWSFQFSKNSPADTGDLRSPIRTMSTTQPNTKTISPEQVAERPSSAALLGIDSEERTHYVGNRPADNSIYVVSDDAVNKFRIEELPVDVDGWIEHVEKTVGWQRKLYEVGLVEHLAEAFK